jgi:hypothetical protein
MQDDSRDSDDRSAVPEKNTRDIVTHEYDQDLVNLLPPFDTIDQFIDYYFEYCNWLYRHLNQPAFTTAWARFKAGQCPDRIVLATVCMIIAITTHFLPRRHPLLNICAGETNEESGRKYHSIMLSALQRYSMKPQAYTLELMELLLLRCQFHTLSRTDSEDIWSVRGEAISVAVAMGLHRDPGRWNMSKEVAERRRWAWWHVLIVER